MTAPGGTSHSAGYLYTLNDEDWRELVSYHWHPHSDVSPARRPHLHVPASTPRVPLNKAHFPTGRVSFESVLRFAIEELGVAPITRDYTRRLDETEATFVARRGWS